MTECGGKVYLVGAGPGDISDCKGATAAYCGRGFNLRCLVNTAVADGSPVALKLDVERWATQYPQAEINQLLVYCLKGKQVVRLKSGDPFILVALLEIEHW